MCIAGLYIAKYTNTQFKRIVLIRIINLKQPIHAYRIETMTKVL